MANWFIRTKKHLIVFIVCMLSTTSAYAYDPQFSVGLSGSERAEEYRYGAYAEYFNEKMFMASTLGLWPRIEYDTDGNNHALFINSLSLFGMVNLEYAYSSQSGEKLHSYGVELNSRFIPAALMQFYSMRANRLVRDIEFFGRVHNYINTDGRFYQVGLKLGFYFPGFNMTE